MPSSDPDKPGTPSPDSAEADLVEELVARLLAAEDLSTEMGMIERSHPHLHDRVCSIHRRLVREDLVLPDSPIGSDPPPIEGYRLDSRLGRGGMGVVYLAQQSEPHRQVAIKFLRPDLLDVESSRTRFRHEITAVARLQHPGIVQVFEAREDSDPPYFVMEYVQGSSLATVITALRGRDPARLSGADLARILGGHDDKGSTQKLAASRSWEEVCLDVASQICEALQHAHDRGVLHRDIKPSNILLTPDGRVRLLDFGLARLEGETRLTRSEAELGSLPFIPPENLQGSVMPSERRDVYGLGVTMYELLTLHNPFLAQEASETRRRVLKAQPQPLRQLNAAISWELETVIQKAMAPEPTLRYASARRLAEDLERVRRREPILARRPGPLLLFRRWTQRHPSLTSMFAVTLVLLVVGSLVFAMREGQARRQSDLMARQVLESAYVAQIRSASLTLDRGGSLEEVHADLSACAEDLRGFEWRHLVQRADAAVEEIPLRGSRILQLQWSQDGKSLAVMRRDGEIVVLDKENKKLRLRWTHPGLSAASLAWRPGHEQILYSLSDGSIHLRSTRGEQWYKILQGENAKPGEVTSLVFDSTGDRFYSGHQNGMILKWSAGDEWRSEILSERSEAIFRLDMPSTDDSLVISTYAGSGGVQASVRVMQLETKKERRFEQQGVFVVEGITDRAGQHLFVASNAGLEHIDLASDRRRFLMRGASIYPVLSHDESQLAFLYGKRQIQVLELVKQHRRQRETLISRPLSRLQGHCSQVFALTQEPATKRFWSGGDDPSLRAWDAMHGSPMRRLPGSAHRVTALICLDDDRILTADSKGQLLVHSPRGQEHLALVSKSEVTDLRLVAGESVLVAHQDGTLACVRLSNGSIRTKEHHPGLTCAVGWGSRRIVGNQRGQVQILSDSETMASELPETGDSPISSLDCTQGDSAILVTANKEGELRAYDLRTRKLLWLQDAHAGWVSAIRIGPRGSRVASIGQDRSLRIWDLGDGTLLHDLPGMDRAPLALCFSPRGDRLVTSSGYGRELRIWDPGRGALLATLATQGVPFAVGMTEGRLWAAGMSDFAFGGAGRMGELQCWVGDALELPMLPPRSMEMDLITPAPIQIR